MLAASLPDLDGFTYFGSDNAYGEYHHKLSHNLMVSILVTVVLAVFSSHRVKAGLIYFLLFHCHLVMDYFGSGPGWGIYYFWPFSSWIIDNPHAWEFVSWQNITAYLVCLAWTLAIVKWQGRTPVEYVLPRIDAQVVELLCRKK